MKELAEKLKAAREQKGLTLQQIHEKTRISTKYLEALEEGRFSDTPGEVYLKGFLRSFAEEVGLDPEAVLAEYRTLKFQAENPDTTTPGAGESTAAPALAAGPAPAAMESPKPKKVKEVTQVQFTAIMVAAVLIISGLASSLISAFFANHAAPEGEGAPTEKMATVEHGTAPVEEPAVEATTSQPAAPAEEPAVVPTPVPQGVTLDLSVALEACWTRVQVDGKDAYEGTLYKGDQKTWKAENEIRVVLGNPGVTKVVFNGQPVEIQGEDVVYLSFTREGMKRLRLSR